MADNLVVTEPRHVHMKEDAITYDQDGNTEDVAVGGVPHILETDVDGNELHSGRMEPNPVFDIDAKGDVYRVDEADEAKPVEEEEESEQWAVPVQPLKIREGTSSELYRDNPDYPAKRLMSSGHNVDFVFVYKLPLNHQSRSKLLTEAKDPQWDGTDSAVKRARKRLVFEKNLIDEGLVVEREYIDRSELVFVKIHVPFELMQEEAETFRLKKALSNEVDELEDATLLGYLTKGMKEVTNRTKTIITGWMDPKVHPEEDYYSAPFKMSRKKRFKRWWDEKQFFSQAERNILTFNILKRVPYGHSHSMIGITRLVAAKGYEDAFPLHDGYYKQQEDEDPGDLRTLHLEWGNLWVFYKFQPLDGIRSYFGEKIALYFAYLGYYTAWLWIPAIVGVLVMVYGIGTYDDQLDSKELCDSKILVCPLCDTCDKWALNSTCTSYKAGHIFDNEATIVFAFFMSLWATVFIDFWKRRNAELSYDWDVRDYEEEENDRPEFRGAQIRTNPVTGVNEKYYPPYRRALKYLLTFATIILMITLVVLVVISIIVYRLAVRIALFQSTDDDESYARQNASVLTSITAALLNLISIVLLNKLYDKIAVVLTDWENHRKESQYDDHLALKIFVFQFVNSYSSLFYIAFFKGNFSGRPGDYDTLFGFRQDQCPAYGCLLELTIQLFVIMVGKQTINNFQEVIWPLLLVWCGKKSESSQVLMSVDRALTPWEKDYLLFAQYPKLGLFKEYLEMVIQFGFITLFVAALPLAPLFALLNNLSEIRVDARKQVTGYRRAIALRAENIGVWSRFISWISWGSVATNGLVIAFTSSYLVKRVYEARYSPDDSLRGYIDRIYPESPVATGPDSQCRYHGFLEDNGEKGQFYYEILAIRLAFALLFEHVVFVMKYMLMRIIPNVPRHVRIHTQRENYLARQALEEDVISVGSALRSPGMRRRQVGKINAQNEALGIPSSKNNNSNIRRSIGVDPNVSGLSDA